MNWLLFATKASVVILSFLFALAFRVRVDERHVAPLQYITLLWLFRDFLYLFLPSPAVLFVSDLAVLTGFLIWLRTYTGSRATDRVWYLVGGIASVLAVLDAFGLPVFIAPARLIVWTFAVIYLGTAFMNVSLYNTPGAELVTDTRIVLIGSWVAVGISSLLMGYQDLVLLHLIHAATYLSVWYILLVNFQLVHTMNELTILNLKRQEATLFDFMETLGEAIAERKPIKNILQEVVSTAVRSTEADGGTIWMVQEESGVLRLSAMEGFYPPPFPCPEGTKRKSSAVEEYLWNVQIPIGKTPLGEAVSDAEPIFVKSSDDDERLSANIDKDILYIKSFIAVPLLVEDRVMGILSLVRRAQEAPFSDEDYGHVRTFANHASMTIDNYYTYLEALEKREIEREVNIAADIQEKLVPRSFPKSRRMEIGVYSNSARGVSGDYYDVLKLDDNKLGIVMCDVAGKGVPAALVMVMIHSILRLIASPKRDVAATLTWINRGLSGQIDLDHYATMSYLTIDENDMVLTYSNAAHHPLMLVRNGSGSIEKVDTQGLPVGIERDMVYPQKRVRIQQGDVMVLYTDGIIEAMNPQGEQFTIERLTEVVRAHREGSATELTKAIRSSVEEFVGSARQHDDQTLLVLKAT